MKKEKILVSPASAAEIPDRQKPSGMDKKPTGNSFLTASR